MARVGTWPVYTQTPDTSANTERVVAPCSTAAVTVRAWQPGLQRELEAGGCGGVGLPLTDPAALMMCGICQRSNLRLEDSGQWPHCMCAARHCKPCIALARNCMSADGVNKCPTCRRLSKQITPRNTHVRDWRAINAAMVEVFAFIRFVYAEPSFAFKAVEYGRCLKVILAQFYRVVVVDRVDPKKTFTRF
jgi:hypothetical protein